MALHRKYGSNERIQIHCKTVAKVAALVADEFQKRGKTVDSRVVIAGALLHDIGRAKVQTVRHGLEGATMLEREGVDQKVVEVVRRHVGAGISAAEAGTTAMALRAAEGTKGRTSLTFGALPTSAPRAR